VYLQHNLHIDFSTFGSEADHVNQAGGQRRESSQGTSQRLESCYHIEGYGVLLWSITHRSYDGQASRWRHHCTHRTCPRELMEYEVLSLRFNNLASSSQESCQRSWGGRDDSRKRR